MNAETIIQLITVLIGSGGIVALFLIAERKTKAQTENITTAIEQWQKIVGRSQSELEDAQARAKEFRELYMIQFDINTKLRKELDEKNTRIAVLSLLRCHKLRCIDREPPFGYEVATEDKQQELEET